MLRPRHTRRPFEIMLIGPIYSGKRTLAEEFLQCRDVFVKINLDNELTSEYKGRTDFILLMVDMTNRKSLKLLKDMIDRIDDVYLLNKLGIVITKVDIPEKWAFEIKDIHEITQAHLDLQIFHVNLIDGKERKTIVDQISRLIKINTLQFPNINIEYVKSQEYYPEGPADTVLEESFASDTQSHRSQSFHSNRS